MTANLTRNDSLDYSGQRQDRGMMRNIDFCTTARGSIILFIISLAILGNFFIILTYCRNFKMRTVTNTLVVSLCISDLLSAVVATPIWVFEIVHKQPLYSNTICRIMLSLNDFFLVAALVNMCGIALDRFITLVKGLRRKMTRTRAKIIVAWSWLQAFISAVPWCLANSTCENRCFSFCPHIYEPQISPRPVNIIFKFTSLIFPIFSIYYVFVRILHSVRSSRKINLENSYISRNSSAEKFAVDAYKRSSKTAMILFTMFIFCTLPYLGIFIFSIFTGKAANNFNAEFVIYCLFSLKRSLFPVIYIFRNRMIISYLQETFRCRICGTNSRATARDSFVFPENNSSSCFVLFSHSSGRSRVHPSVYDGDHRHFPKNLDVYFAGNIKEPTSVIEERFVDIVAMERKDTEPRIVLPVS